jgi:hypothetical protein
VNPYGNTGPNLENASIYPYLIAPDDGADLPRVCKALRIYNPTAGAVTVKLTSTGGSTITITIPPSTLWVEEIVTQKVFLTGTSVGITIHGYSD